MDECDIKNRLRSFLDAGDILFLSSIRDFWNAGRCLSNIKELLKDKDWESWLESNSFDKEDAAYYLSLYEDNPVWDHLEKKFIEEHWN